MQFFVDIERNVLYYVVIKAPLNIKKRDSSIMRNTNILSFFKKQANIQMNKYKRRTTGSNGSLRCIHKLSLSIDYYATAQYLASKKIALKSIGFVKYQSNFMLTHHCYFINHHIIPINYQKSVKNLDSIIPNIYPDIVIKFDKNQPHHMNPRKYRRPNYKGLLHELLLLNHNKGNYGLLLIHILNRLATLVNLNSAYVLAFNYNIDIRKIKKEIKKMNGSSKKYDKRLDSRIVQLIDKKYNNHDIYVSVLKILCNCNIYVKF